METGLSGDDNLYAPLSSSDLRGYEPSRRYTSQSPQFPSETSTNFPQTTRDDAYAAAFLSGSGLSPYTEVAEAEDFYRSFRDQPATNSSNSFDADDMPAPADSARQSSSLRSNSNGTTPRHPSVTASRSLRSPYRSVSAPIDEAAAAGGTRAVSGAHGTPKPSVRDIARHINGQATASAHKPSIRPAKETMSHGAGYMRTRAAAETQAPPVSTRAGIMTRDSDRGKPTKTQRTKFTAEDQHSNNTLSGVPRSIRGGAKEATGTSSSTNVTRPPPPKLSAKIPERKPLFGELPPNAAGSSNLGYGIPNARGRGLSASSARSPGAEFSPKSPTSPYDATGELLRDIEASRSPRAKKHGRSRSDLGGEGGGSQGGDAVHQQDSGSVKSHAQSRLPISSRRLGTPSESSSPSSTRSTSPLASKARSPTSMKSPKGSMRARSPMSRSPGRQAHGLANISTTASLSAMISASPPKGSPPLRGSRQRLPVSTATAAGSKLKAAEPSSLSQLVAVAAGGEAGRSLGAEAASEMDQRKETEDAAAEYPETSLLGANTSLLPLSHIGSTENVDAANMDSPTLGMPGTFPSPYPDEEDPPQSAMSATTQFAEFDNDPQTDSFCSESRSLVHPSRLLTSMADFEQRYDDSPLDMNSGCGSIKIILDTALIGGPQEVFSADSSTSRPSYALSPDCEESPELMLATPQENKEPNAHLDDLGTVATNISTKDQFFEEPQSLTTNVEEMRVYSTSFDVEQLQNWRSESPTQMQSLNLPEFEHTDLDLSFPAESHLNQETSPSPVTEMEYDSSDGGGAEGLHGLPGHYDTPHSARLSLPYPYRPTNRASQQSESDWRDEMAFTVAEPGRRNSDRFSSASRPDLPLDEGPDSARPEVPPKSYNYNPLPSPGLFREAPQASSSSSHSLHNEHRSNSHSHDSGGGAKSPLKAYTVPFIPAPLNSPPPIPETQDEAPVPETRDETPIPQTRDEILISQTRDHTTYFQAQKMISPLEQAKSDGEHTSEEPSKPVALTEDQATKLTKRCRIIMELVDTEAMYLKDMNVVEEIYKGTARVCPNFEAADVKTIFRNSGQVVGFSTMFLDELKAAAASVYVPRPSKSRLSKVAQVAGESTSPSENPAPEPSYERDQKTYIGANFLRHLKDMKIVYTEFLKSHEIALNRLMALQNEPAVKIWLDECNLVAKDLTTAWDLDALLIKPVQRITRYLLFLTELKGKTPEDHPDYNAISAAREGIHELLQSIDALKKRLDTVSKIVNENPKVNVRTGIATAFARRRDRSQATNPNRPKDDHDFIRAFDKFNNDYLRLQIVMRDVEFYTRKTKEFVTGFFTYLSAIEMFARGNGGSGPYPELESKWMRFNVSMRDLSSIALENHITAVRKLVIEPFESVIKTYAAPNTAISKRLKRRHDYEKWLSMKAANKKIDERTTELVEQYDALNETLKLELPKLSTLTEKVGKVCLERFVIIQTEWWATWEAKITAVLDAIQMPKDIENIIGQFRREFRYMDLQIQELGIVKGDFSNSTERDHLSQSTTATKDDDASVHSRAHQGNFSAASRPHRISVNSDYASPLPTPELQNRLSDGTTPNSDTASSSHQTFDHPSMSIASSSHQTFGHPSASMAKDIWQDSPAMAALTATLGTRLDPRHSFESGGPSHGSVDAGNAVTIPAATAIPSTGRIVESGGSMLGGVDAGVDAGDGQTIPTIPTTPAIPVIPVRTSSASQSQYHDTPEMPSQRLHSSYPVEFYENPESSTSSPAASENTGDYTVLYIAASLFEFDFSGDKRVGDYRYLTYQAGEIFDVIGEYGELWLARNQDDGDQEIGWIWSKHFAKLTIT